MSKIYVVCPGEVVTGGPELLHQLVSMLNENGRDASIIYSPFNFSFDVPSQYSKYNVNVVSFNSITFSPSDIVILPEVYTGYVRKFPGVSIYIWWLSVDNYFLSIPIGFYQQVKEFVKQVIGHRNSKPSQVKIADLCKYNHLYQSEYARLFLKEKGIDSLPLSDFLNEEHTKKELKDAQRDNIICYNPKKGAVHTYKLITSLKDYKFIPIINMTANEVSDLLARAKVYVDFGNHPGKDRIPREAAMAGCVVITGRQGSANNIIDIPVPEKYKIDELGPHFIDLVKDVVDDSFSNYEVISKDFDGYRERIKSERDVFEKQVLSIF